MTSTQRGEPYADVLPAAEALLNSSCRVSRYGAPITETGYAVKGVCQSIAALPFHPDYDGTTAAREVALWIQRQPSNVDVFTSERDSTGRIIFDGASIREDLVEAQLLAIIRGEKTIWSFEREEFIEV